MDISRAHRAVEPLSVRLIDNVGADAFRPPCQPSEIVRAAALIVALILGSELTAGDAHHSITHTSSAR